MEAIGGFAVFIMVLAVFAVIFIAKSVRVVPQQEAWVVERFGKFHTVLQPGLNFIIPIIDRVAYRQTLKEIPYVPVCQLSKGIYLFKQKFHFLIRLLKAIRRITDQDSFKGTGLK